MKILYQERFKKFKKILLNFEFYQFCCYIIKKTIKFISDQKIKTNKYNKKSTNMILDDKDFTQIKKCQMLNIYSGTQHTLFFSSKTNP